MSSISMSNTIKLPFKSKLIIDVVKKYSAFCVVKSISVIEIGLFQEYVMLPFVFSRVKIDDHLLKETL